MRKALEQLVSLARVLDQIGGERLEKWIGEKAEEREIALLDRILDTLDGRRVIILVDDLDRVAPPPCQRSC